MKVMILTREVLLGNGDARRFAYAQENSGNGGEIFLVDNGLNLIPIRDFNGNSARISRVINGYSKEFPFAFVKTADGNFNWINADGQFVFEETFSSAEDFEKRDWTLAWRDDGIYAITRNFKLVSLSAFGWKRATLPMSSTSLRWVWVGNDAEYGCLQIADDGVKEVLRIKKDANFAPTADPQVLRLTTWWADSSCIFVKPNGDLLFTKGEASSISRDYEGKRAVRLKNNLIRYINNQGETVIAQEFASGTGFHHGYACVITNDSCEKRWRYIDHNGNFAFGCFEIAEEFKEVNGKTLAKVKLSENEWNFLKSDGNFLLREHVARAGDFVNGISMVVTRDGYEQVIDCEGNYMLPFDKKIWQYKAGTLESRCFFAQDRRGNFLKWDGKELKQTSIKSFYFMVGDMVVYANNKDQLIVENVCNEEVACETSSARAFQGFLACKQSREKTFMLFDKKGKMLVKLNNDYFIDDHYESMARDIFYGEELEFSKLSASDGSVMFLSKDGRAWESIDAWLDWKWISAFVEEENADGENLSVKEQTERSCEKNQSEKNQSEKQSKKQSKKQSEKNQSKKQSKNQSKKQSEKNQSKKQSKKQSGIK